MTGPNPEVLSLAADRELIAAQRNARPTWHPTTTVGTLIRFLDALEAAEAENARLRATVERVEALAQQRAMSARALGHATEERGWLDVLIILENAALAPEGGDL